MNLAIGITKELPEWAILASQIGITLASVGQTHHIDQKDYALIIVTEKGNNQLKTALLLYLKSGGSLLLEAEAGQWLFGFKATSAYIQYIDDSSNSTIKNVVPGFIRKSLLLPENADFLFSDSSKKLIKIKKVEKGTAIILPGNLIKAVLDTRVQRMNFSSPGGSPFPSERVTRTSKNVILSIVRSCLEELFFSRSLPFINLWQFPQDEKTFFNFRIDTDFASKADIESLYKLCKTYNIPASWFVETNSPQDWLNVLKSMKQQEIGLHCFTHKVYRNFVENEQNIKLGINLLNGVGISPKGFAAPFGMWNSSLMKAVEHHNFIYSSEFTLDYDNLPFFPYLNDRFSSVLQIPVHPVSIGRLRNAHLTEEQMTNYFLSHYELCSYFNLPFFIYHHPSDGMLSVLESVFKFVKEKKCSMISLNEYASWWKLRKELILSASLNDNKIMVKLNYPDSSLYLSVKRNSDEYKIIPVNEIIDLNSLQWELISTGQLKHVPMWKLNRFHWKNSVNDLEHFGSRLTI